MTKLAAATLALSLMAGASAFAQEAGTAAPQTDSTKMAGDTATTHRKTKKVKTQRSKGNPSTPANTASPNPTK